jgi:hypothetical protein
VKAPLLFGSVLSALFSIENPAFATRLKRPVVVARIRGQAEGEVVLSARGYALRMNGARMSARIEEGVDRRIPESRGFFLEAVRGSGRVDHSRLYLGRSGSRVRLGLMLAGRDKWWSGSAFRALQVPAVEGDALANHLRMSLEHLGIGGDDATYLESTLGQRTGRRWNFRSAMPNVALLRHDRDFLVGQSLPASGLRAVSLPELWGGISASVQLGVIRSDLPTDLDATEIDHLELFQ